MIYDTDPYLSPYRGQIDRRYRELVIRKQELAGYGKRLADAVNNHLYYGVHADGREVVFREWAPNATAVYLIGDVNGWRKDEKYRLRSVGNGNWELRLSAAEMPHGSLFRWLVEWNGGSRYGFLLRNTAGGIPASSRITAAPSSTRPISA